MESENLKPINTKKLDDDDDDDEPLSPTARFFQAPSFNCCIIAVLGSNTLFDLNIVKFGLHNSLVKHPRFSSCLVTDEKKRGGLMRWRRTKVDLNNHVFYPDLDPNMDLADQFVEDYISSLTNSGLDPAKPLWELHILNVKTSDANALAVLKIHHSIGDGISLISLLLACTRKASDLEAMPSFPKIKRATSSNSIGFWGLLFTIWTTIVMAFNTFVDVMIFAATALFLKDTDTPIKGASGVVGLTPKRIVHRIVSLNDIKLVKTAMNMTINDVILGVTSAGLSHYLNGRYENSRDEQDEDIASKKRNNLPQDIHLRATILFNIRPSAGIEDLADMMEKESKVRWGNWMGYVLLPISIGLEDDPLDYIRKAKATIDRKKLSFEAICSFCVGRLILDLFGLKWTAALMYKIVSNTTMSFSNVVGPEEEVSFYGHHLAYVAPSVYGQPQALTIHWQSYGDKMILVLTVDPNVIPDPRKLCTDLEVSLKLIKDAVIQRGLAVPSPLGSKFDKNDRK